MDMGLMYEPIELMKNADLEWEISYPTTKTITEDEPTRIKSGP